MESRTILSQEQLIILLSNLTSKNPNPTQLKESQKLLKSYSKTIESVEGFLSIMQTNSDAHMRQLSSVLLNRKIEQHWINMPEEHQAILTKALISLVSNEKVSLVRRAIANNITKICKTCLTATLWNPLLDFVFTDPSNYSAEQSFLFEINLYILSELIENAAFTLKNKLAEIKNILTLALNHGNNKMKEYSTKCLGSLVRGLEKTEILPFKDLIPLIFKEIKTYSEETVLHIYETFCDFHENSLDFFDNYFDDLLPFTIGLITSEEYGNNTKQVFAEFLQMVSECKKKLYTKNNSQYLKMAIEAGFHLAATGIVDHDKTEKEEDDDESMDSYMIGLRIIDYISLTISSRYVFPIWSSCVQAYLSSSNVNQRRVAIASFGAIAEGCAEKLREKLSDVVDTLINSFYNDPDTEVKVASIVSMDYLVQFCAPDILDFHEKVIPMLIKGLYSAEDEVIEKSLTELNYFCKSLDFELEAYIDTMMPRLFELLTNHKSVAVQSECLFALSSIINSGQHLLEKTLLPILETCKQIIETRTKAEEVELRSNAMDCVATIAFVIKLEQFQPYLAYFSEVALNFVKSESYEFQDAGFSYFGSVAKIMGQPFSANLPVLMPIAMHLLKDDSGIQSGKTDGNGDEFGVDSDSEDEDALDENGEMNVDFAFIDAKCSVILAITHFAQACPKEFIEYLGGVFAQFEQLWEYIHENVDVELISAYEGLLMALNQAELDKPLNERLAYKAWANDLFPKYEEIIREGDLKELVIKSFESIYNLIDYFKKEILYPNNIAQRLIDLIKALLNYKLACQIKNKDEEDEDIDHEERLLGTAVDNLIIMAEVLENDFHQFLSDIFTNLKVYLGVKRSTADRSIVFGLFADILRYCRISVPIYIDQLFTSINDNMSKADEDSELYRHIAYLIGIFFEAGPDTALPYLEHSLNILHKIYQETENAAKDNVLAAISRIIIGLKLTPAHPMFNQLLSSILGNVPFTSDPLENPNLLKLFDYLASVADLDTHKSYLNNIFNTCKFIVLHELKAGTKLEDYAKVRLYLEKLGQNPELKQLIEQQVGAMTEAERQRFIGSMNK